MYALTPEAMREIDRLATVRMGVNGRSLMQNAGLCAVQIIEEKAEGREKTALVLCGSGNNGGDGYVIATELVARGWDVAVFEDEPSKQRPDAAAYHRKRARRATKNYYPLESGEALDYELSCAAFIVDAVFGTGFHGELPEPLCAVFDACNNTANAFRVAVDCPSGADPTTGTVCEHAFRADLTVCMSYPMRGLYFLPAREIAGKLEICDIGIDYARVERTGDFNDYVTDADTIRRIMPRRNADTNKSDYGRALLICGSRKYPGAAVLALGGALRMGAGLCELCAPAPVCAVAAARYPEAIFTEIPDSSEWKDADIALLLSRAAESDAVLVGCGLGNQGGVGRLVSALLSSEGGTLVLDADALNALAAAGYPGDRIMLREVILTPHPLEFSRLCGKTTGEIALDKYTEAREYAVARKVTLLLKGADTVAVSPDGRMYLNPSGNPGLAKGGSGDVLAGMCAGLAAQRIPALECAAAAAFLHGAAADLLASELSEYAFLPGELAAAAGRVLAGILGR